MQMKKIVTLVVVLLVLLVAAPWAIGRLAEKRVNDGLDKLVQEAPYLTIVERKWTGGWFRSEQEVTFEVFGAWIDAMNPKKVMEAAKAELPVESAETPVTAEDELAQRKLSALPGEAAPEVEAAAPPAPLPTPEPDVAKPAERIRFTLRNEILHGPVLWPASLGLARVNTRLVLSDQVRQELVKFFGTDEPVRVSHRVGFFGGGSTRLFGDGRTVNLNEGGVLEYDDFEVEVDYSGNFDDVDMDGSWAKLEFTEKAKGERLEVRGMSLDGDSERIVGDLYDSDFEFEIDQVLFVGADKMETTVDDVHYNVDTSHKDGFLDLSARFGSGRIRNPAFEELQLDLRQVNYDFTARHLHIETLQKLIETIKAAYASPMNSVGDLDAAVMAPMKQHGVALLKYDPEFVIDRIGILTAEGEAVIKGVVRLQGLTEADLALLEMGRVIDKVVADLTIEVAQPLLEKIPNGATGAGLAVDQGFAKRDGDKLVSRIEFKNGELQVNGKPLPIPGLGGPPVPQDGFPAEEPPPQE
jgi:uncharacterized protein YdgA (DUF945 family)